MPLHVLFPDQADFLCPCKAAVGTCAGVHAILDLSGTRFAKPFGILLLYGLVTDLRRSGVAVRVKIGSPDVAGYLWRMDVHKPFIADEGVVFEPDLKEMRRLRIGHADRLLELTVIEVTNDDEVIAAEEQIWSIIEDRARQIRPLREQIRTALSEVISNVEGHSRTTRAAVVAQTHRDCAVYPIS